MRVGRGEGSGKGKTCGRGHKGQMSRKGHNVTEAGDAHTALQLCQTRHFDVAVVDLNMPGMNGLELLDRLHGDQIEMQVLMLTGQSEEDDIVTGLEVGADDYMTKPFSPKLVDARVKALLRRGSGESLP